MLTFEFEQPMLISGVIINEEALKHLSYIQTGTCYISNANYRKHTNEGVNNFIDDCNAIIHHLLGDLLQADADEKPKIIDTIERAYYLLRTFDGLKLPDELLSKTE